MRKYAAALLLLLSACSTPRTQLTSANDTTQILRDERDVAAIGAAYHERVRLGLGSPFRVIEIAAHDARFTPAQRDELMADLFERVLDANTYQIGATLPLAHYRVIEHALNSTHDPRIAEVAVNLAYEVAVTELTVTPELQYAAAGTIALLRDRALAQHDAKHVRTVARTHNLAPHTLVPAMRAQRALLVEQPLQPALNAEAEEAASRLAVMLVGGVRQAARTPQPHVPQPETSELTYNVAEKILRLQDPVKRPPQSALTIAMRAAQLPYNGRDEESFVAELALIRQHATLAAQRAALALRPFAQEPVHVDTHVPVPGAKDFLAKYGVTVRFRDDVPAGWHAHYARALDRALADLQVAIPGISLKGLTVEIGEVSNKSGHLAWHDPRSRTIRWAPATGAGSLAHEIGHDIDWQIARRSYGRSGYASDVAGMLLSPADSPAGRATEAFARQFDWVVAAALAAEGRLNGQLSSVQHDWLPGHGSARSPLPNTKSANGLAAMVGRAGAPARMAVERAVRAPDVPAAVRGVRQVRGGGGAIAEMTGGQFTQEYLILLRRAAGQPFGHEPSESRTPCCKTPSAPMGVSAFKLLTFPL